MGRIGAIYSDVKGQNLYRWLPKEPSRKIVLGDAGRISASFFNHGQLFLSDNGESRIARLDAGSKVDIAGHAKEAEPRGRPNDLVVDNRGGIYYTLTNANDDWLGCRPIAQSAGTIKLE